MYARRKNTFALQNMYYNMYYIEVLKPLRGRRMFIIIIQEEHTGRAIALPFLFFLQITCIIGNLLLSL